MPRSTLSLRVCAIVGVISLGMISACSAQSDDTAPVSDDNTLIGKAPIASIDELQQSPTAMAIKQRGRLVIGGDVNLPLVSQQNPTTGQTEGFDASLGKMLAKYITGQSAAKIVSVTADTREALLRLNTVDAVIRIYTITPERAKKVGFAGPYLQSGQAIATLKTTHGISGPADLAGKKVCAVTRTTSLAAVKKYAPQAIPLTLGNSFQCVQALEEGKADAYVHDLTVLAGAAQLNSKIQIVGSTFANDPYGIGIRKGDESFKKFINIWLQKIEQEGLWKQAWKESLGSVISGSDPKPPRIGGVPGT